MGTTFCLTPSNARTSFAGREQTYTRIRSILLTLSLSAVEM
jgi:hypothetical protein